MAFVWFAIGAFCGAFIITCWALLSMPRHSFNHPRHDSKASKVRR